jgi:hypothetical protein
LGILVGPAVGGVMLLSCSKAPAGCAPARAPALLLAIVWRVAPAGFALTRTYPLALVLLFVAGFFELSFGSRGRLVLTAALLLRGRRADEQSHR